MKFATSKMTVDGKTVEVRELSARQRQDLFNLNKDNAGPIEIQANLIKMGCSAFVETEIDEILDMPGSVVDEISQEVMKLSGLAEDDEKN